MSRIVQFIGNGYCYKHKIPFSRHSDAYCEFNAEQVEFRPDLGLEEKWYGREIIIADTFFPSSKTCSCCGWKNDNLTLKDRIFKCEICKNEIDRDLNASKNLLKLCSASSARNYALGDGSSVCPVMDKSSPSLKKESNGKFTYTLKV